jgi:hypothetical protein
MGIGNVAKVTACLAALVCSGALADAQTTINEGLFALSLPGEWKGGYDRKSDSWHYRSASGREAVTVGVRRRTGGRGAESMKDDFRAYLETRRKAERDLGGPALRLGKPQVQERPTAILARYSAFEPGRKRRTLTRVIVNEVAAGSFCYEATGYAAAAFDARAKVVLGKVGLIGE